MKLKFTRKSVIVGMLLLLIPMIFISLWLFNNNTILFNDTIGGRHGSDFGWIHLGINTIAVLSFFVWLILFIWELVDDGDNSPLKSLYRDTKRRDKNDSNSVTVNNWSFKKFIVYGLLIIFTLYSFKLFKTVYNESVFMYNTSKLYHNSYQQKVEEKQGFYDKLWKTYLQKEKITNINKETFLVVTKMIMENRKDGQNVTWKWLQENQQIPYDEFTKFYSDLSVFITTQREGYFNIEKECQVIANRNNTLLDTFPNNIYNKVLKLNKIKFEYGFLSDSTNNVFKNKVENIK